MWANGIAGVAFVVSVASALLAWRSASEAKLANKISIHEYQRKLYDAFFDAHKLLQLEGQHAEISEFSKLVVHINTAHLYVDKSVAAKLKEFSEAYVDVYDGACKVRYTSRVSAEASKRHLESLVSDPLEKFLSEKADKAAEEAQIEADAALQKALKIGAGLNRIFMEEIKLS